MNTSPNTIARNVFDIMLVEDSEVDAYLLKEFCSQHAAPFNFQVIENGEEAISNITQRVKQRKPLPDLLVLDLNLPRMNGFEVLSHLQEELQNIDFPVAILSSSLRSSDRETSLMLGAKCFLIKPSRLSDYNDVIGAFDKLLR